MGARTAPGPSSYGGPRRSRGPPLFCARTLARTTPTVAEPSSRAPDRALVPARRGVRSTRRTVPQSPIIRATEEVAMHYGIVMFPTDYAIRPDELARAAEAARLRVAVVPRAHAHPGQPAQPVAGRRPSCPRSTGTPTIRSWRSTMAAAATTKLKLGTGICLVIERDPIITAKEVASLDQLSGGRFLFGIGGGWNAEEMENHGTAFKTRFRRAARARPGDEGDLDEGRGRVPRRVRQLRPDLVVAEARAAARTRRSSWAATAPTTFDRVLEYCDGWMPVAGRMGPAFADKIAHAAAPRQGSGPRTHPGDRLHGQARPRGAGPARGGRRASARSSASPPRRRTRCFPSSTSTPS